MITREEIYKVLTEVEKNYNDLNTENSNDRRFLRLRSDSVNVQNGALETNFKTFMFDDLILFLEYIKSNNGIYNRALNELFLSEQGNNNNYRNCGVHIIAMLLVKLGYLEIINIRSYRLIK